MRFSSFSHILHAPSIFSFYIYEDPDYETFSVLLLVALLFSARNSAQQLKEHISVF